MAQVELENGFSLEHLKLQAEEAYKQAELEMKAKVEF